MPKVDEIDFKTGEQIVPSEAGQAEETPEEAPETKEEPRDAKVSPQDETKVEEVKEDVESLPQWAKEKLKKTEEDKENYKKGMMKYKSKTLTPETKVEEEKEEESYPDWDETSKKFQEQTTKKASQIAEQKAKQIVEGFNEKAAITNFVSKHSELEDDSLWQEVISNYNAKNGKESISSIEKDLERAYFTTRFERGEISELESKAFKKGEQKGKSDAVIADLSSVSKTTSKSVKESGNVVSSGAIKLAERMKVDTTKLAAEDDTLTAEIKY